jgi:hypothetical protein
MTNMALRGPLWPERIANTAPMIAIGQEIRSPGIHEPMFQNHLTWMMMTPRAAIPTGTQVLSLAGGASVVRGDWVSGSDVDGAGMSVSRCSPCPYVWPGSLASGSSSVAGGGGGVGNFSSSLLKKSRGSDPVYPRLGLASLARAPWSLGALEPWSLGALEPWNIFVGTNGFPGCSCCRQIRCRSGKSSRRRTALQQASA